MEVAQTCHFDIRGIYNDHIKAMETFKLEMNEDEGRDDEY